MSKDKKNIDKSLISVFKTLLTIAIIVTFTFVIMAVITHFSLNYKLETYNFTDSLLFIFNPESSFFKFFEGFILLNVIWILLAVFIKFISKQLIK